MRVLCCLDGSNAERMGKALEMLSANTPLEVGMIYVIDSRPRKDIDMIRERFLRPPMHPPPHASPPPQLGSHHPPPEMRPAQRPREEEMSEAEKSSAQEILDEGRRYFSGAEALEREGRPELEIVNAAAEWRADLLVVCSRAACHESRGVGPKSVGHVARFVVDHAPCPVLMLRPITRELFPIGV